MDAFIQAKIDADGKLSLVIFKPLWEELYKAMIEATAESQGDFVEIRLTSLTSRNLKTVEDTGGSEEFPCKPIFDIGPET